MATQEVLIQGRTFIAPAPYVEGHVINAHEAAALNQTLAENLRNNFAARMKRAADEERELTQSDFDEYAATYSFGVRQPRGPSPLRDPVRTEERKLAAAAIKRAILAKGIKLKDVPDETFEAYVNAAIETGRYRADAQKLVALRTSLTSSDVEIDFAA